MGTLYSFIISYPTGLSTFAVTTNLVPFLGNKHKKLNKRVKSYKHIYLIHAYILTNNFQHVSDLIKRNKATLYHILFSSGTRGGHMGSLPRDCKCTSIQFNVTNTYTCIQLISLMITKSLTNPLDMSSGILISSNLFLVFGLNRIMCLQSFLFGSSFCWNILPLTLSNN